MNERFSNWLNSYPEFKESTNIRMIFDDAIKCFKHSIARPALLLSYIAFMQAVKNNILSSLRPPKVKEMKWDNVLINLRKDDKWESTVYDAIAYQGNVDNDERLIFEMSQALRGDIAYWRNRRNDCAHYKDNEISLSHVCAFWSFIMSSYRYFMPLGGINTSVKLSI